MVSSLSSSAELADLPDADVIEVEPWDGPEYDPLSVKMVSPLSSSVELADLPDADVTEMEPWDEQRYIPTETQLTATQNMMFSMETHRGRHAKGKEKAAEEGPKLDGREYLVSG
jgi:hypothetical protein